MSTHRKILSEITSKLKQIEEVKNSGLEQGCDNINKAYEKVQTTANITNKAKYIEELKKEIKKLQRQINL